MVRLSDLHDFYAGSEQDIGCFVAADLEVVAGIEGYDEPVRVEGGDEFVDLGALAATSVAVDEDFVRSVFIKDAFERVAETSEGVPRVRSLDPEVRDAVPEQRPR